MATTWTKSAILALVETNEKAIEKGILYLFTLQTSDEQVSHDTKWFNMRGFSKRTVTRGQRIAEKLLRGVALDYVDYIDGREVCAIHWRQLLARAEWSAGAKAQEAALAPHVAEFERWMALS